MSGLDEHIQANGGMAGVYLDPTLLTPGQVDMQIVLSERIAQMSSLKHNGGYRAVRNEELARNPEPQDLADIFLFAASLTGPCSIGAAFIAQGSASNRMLAAFGAVHRHPEWAGLGVGMTQARGRSQWSSATGREMNPPHTTSV